MTIRALSGASWSVPLSNSTEAAQPLRWPLAVYLAALGTTAVALHAGFRWPLHLPGHHGLEWMALLVFGQATAANRWSASLTGATAGGVSLLPVWGFHDPLGPVSYLLAGVVLDGLHRLRLPVPWWLRLPGFAALAFAVSAVPLLMTSEHGAGIGAPAYLGSHALFGLIGGLAGAVLGRHTARAVGRAPIN